MPVAATTGSASDLFRAIRTQWLALVTAGTLPSTINGPYRDRKPPGSSVGFPYVIFTSIANVRQTTTNTSEYWLRTVEFVIRTATAEATEDLVAQIGNALDPVLFTFADPTKGEAIRRRREREFFREEAQNVYMGSIQYEFLCWKPKAT